MSTTSPRTRRPANHSRLVGLLLFSGLLIGFGFFKAFQDGYFEPRTPLMSAPEERQRLFFGWEYFVKAAERNPAENFLPELLERGRFPC